MQYELGRCGDLADLLGSAAGDLEQLGGRGRDGHTMPGQHLDEPGSLGAAHPHCCAARTRNDVGHGCVCQHFPRPTTMLCSAVRAISLMR